MSVYDGDKQEGWRDYVLFGGIPLVIGFETADQDFKDTVPESIRSQLCEEGVSILPVKIHHRISFYGSFYE